MVGPNKLIPIGDPYKNTQQFGLHSLAAANIDPKLVLIRYTPGPSVLLTPHYRAPLGGPDTLKRASGSTTLQLVTRNPELLDS